MSRLGCHCISDVERILEQTYLSDLPGCRGGFDTLSGHCSMLDESRHTHLQSYICLLRFSHKVLSLRYTAAFKYVLIQVSYNEACKLWSV